MSASTSVGLNSLGSTIQKRRMGTHENLEELLAEKGSSFSAAGYNSTKQPLIQDYEIARQTTRKNTAAQETVDLYRTCGYAQAIVRNGKFASITLLMIAVNSLWIGFEMDLNDEPNLNEAEWYFKVGEYFFFAFFAFEWTVRLLAFRRKIDTLKDFWFCFDTVLVSLMFAETLILPNVMPAGSEEDGGGESGGDGGVGQLSLLRMLRLLRLTRVVRFMRAVPELVTLVKSLNIAMRPVASTFLLLLIFLYIFGIVFKSQLRPPVGSILVDKFGRLTKSMWTLLRQGTFLDSVTKTADPLLELSPALTAVFVVFILLAPFTVLNLLIGMLCEVVNCVAITEKEKAMVLYVKSKLMHVLEELDEDGSGTISKSEFLKLMEVPVAVKALEELGVDVPNLLSLSDHLFAEEECVERGADTAAHGPAEPRDGTAEGRAGAAGTSSESLESEDEDERAVGDKGRYDEKIDQLLDLLHGAREEGHEHNPLENASSSSSSTSEPDNEKVLSFPDFIEMVIRLRAGATLSVIDIVELRKMLALNGKHVMSQLDTIEEQNSKLSVDMQMQICHHPLYQMICNHPLLKRKMGGPDDTGGRSSGGADAGIHVVADAHHSSSTCRSSTGAGGLLSEELRLGRKIGLGSIQMTTKLAHRHRLRRSSAEQRGYAGERAPPCERGGAGDRRVSTPIRVAPRLGAGGDVFEVPVNEVDVPPPKVPGRLSGGWLDVGALLSCTPSVSCCQNVADAQEVKVAVI